MTPSPAETLGSKFTRKMEEAVAAMLTQRTLEEAARSISIGIPTLVRWQKEPEFQAAYREARRAAFGQSIARLQQASSAAVSVLIKVILLERVERDALRGLSIEEQKLLDRAGPPSSVMERYQGMVSAALTDVDDADLDRMILFCQPNLGRAESRA